MDSKGLDSSHGQPVNRALGEASPWSLPFCLRHNPSPSPSAPSPPPHRRPERTHTHTHTPAAPAPNPCSRLPDPPPRPRAHPQPRNSGESPNPSPRALGGWMAWSQRSKCWAGGVAPSSVPAALSPGSMPACSCPTQPGLWKSGNWEGTAGGT